MSSDRSIDQSIVRSHCLIKRIVDTSRICFETNQLQADGSNWRSVYPTLSFSSSSLFPLFTSSTFLIDICFCSRAHRLPPCASIVGLGLVVVLVLELGSGHERECKHLLFIFEWPFARDNADADVDEDANAGRATSKSANGNNNKDDNDKWQTKNIFSKRRKNKQKKEKHF